MSRNDRAFSFGPALRLIGRALLLRCPDCGRPGIFTSWFRQMTQCPQCGLVFERGEQGYIVGAYMFNIVVAELLFALLFVGIVLLTWPTPPWTMLTYGGALLMVLLPIVFYPFSRTLFLAFDLMFRPAREEMPEATGSRDVSGRNRKLT
ncbi:MAG: DUF983 domain-containing protein [Gemmatimonadota bacterium]